MQPRGEAQASHSAVDVPLAWHLRAKNLHGPFVEVALSKVQPACAEAAGQDHFRDRDAAACMKEQLKDEREERRLKRQDTAPTVVMDSDPDSTLVAQIVAPPAHKQHHNRGGQGSSDVPHYTETIMAKLNEMQLESANVVRTLSSQLAEHDTNIKQLTRTC